MMHGNQALLTIDKNSHRLSAFPDGYLKKDIRGTRGNPMVALSTKLWCIDLHRSVLLVNESAVQWNDVGKINSAGGQIVAYFPAGERPYLSFQFYPVPNDLWFSFRRNPIFAIITVIWASTLREPKNLGLVKSIRMARRSLTIITFAMSALIAAIAWSPLSTLFWSTVKQLTWSSPVLFRNTQSAICPKQSYRTSLLSTDPLMIYVEEFVTETEINYFLDLQ